MAQADFLSARADTNTTLDIIKEYYGNHKYMLCPHSAVGVSAIQQLQLVDNATVCLATAHEAKFPAACKMAVDPLPTPPKELSQLYEKKTRSSLCSNDLKVVQKFVEKRVQERLARESASGGTESKDDDNKRILVGLVVASIAVLAFSFMGSKKR